MYDSPHLPVLVGKRVRKRLDVKSMVQLLQKVNAPTGMVVNLMLCEIVHYVGLVRESRNKICIFG